MSFYTDLRDEIVPLLEEFGEQQELSRKPTVADDPSRPWRGTTSTETLLVTAVAPELISGDTDTLKDRDATVYVSGSFSGVDNYDFITLNGNRYRIIRCNRIGSPSTVVAYELTVRA